MTHETVFPISEFLTFSYDEFLGKLTKRHHENHGSLEGTQDLAWAKEFYDLQRILRDKSGHILFEYSIPGLPKTIDVVLLMNGIIYVIEYKAGASKFNSQDIRQTNGYALRLKYFHSRSNDNWIAPILVATEAPNREIEITPSNDDMIYHPILCNSNTLATAINIVSDQTNYKGTSDWEERWSNGIFKASPTIIAAATNVWEKNNVRGFTMGESSNETRLDAENYIVNTVVTETKSRPAGHNKSICFVTGVPGAGKTLVGLNISVALQNEGASMLSGNGPLVAVLTEALKRDLRKNKGNLNKPINEVSVETIIRDAYGYKKEIFDKRLDYTPGEGRVSLRRDAERGTQHVIIFDEAQRAWNKSKMITPGQSGRKYWQEPAFPFSEPGILLWDMNQRDWGVFVCLVGGGQEINTGEAGICEWLETIKSDHQFDGWHIYLSKEFLGNEYNSTDGRTVNDYCKHFDSLGRVTFNSSLHLTACQRSNRSDKVSRFIHELLDCNTVDAKAIYDKIKDKFPIYITRDIEVAKHKLRERRHFLSDRGFTTEGQTEDIRMGILMSSKAARMRPLGFEIKKVNEFLNKVPKWFLDSEKNVISSDFLEIALNEFFVQGLELDLMAVLWDADFRYDPEKNDWTYWEFNDVDWAPRMSDTPSHIIKRFYMKNAYRVLLTRARAGMIIVVPEGSKFTDGIMDDPTRDPQIYDCTYNYLKDLGLREL